MEFVYVVPREELFPDCYPQGLVPFGSAAEREGFERRVREHGFFVERAYAERSPRLKQIIPYVVVQVGGEVLMTRRRESGGEQRLHGKLSIGIGGHVNPADLGNAGSADPVRAPVRNGALREIEEEIEVRGPYELRAIGLLNDDSNPVGAVHLGLVHLAQVNGSVAVREEDVLEGRLVAPDELQRLRARGEDFETWSSILIDRLDELVPTRLTQPN